jgi:hypothetical protein
MMTTELNWLLWPIGVCLLILLVQCVLLAYGLLDCLTILRYELLPMLKDIRLTAAHVEDISQRVVSGSDLLKKGVSSSRVGLQALVAGINRSFQSRR